MKVTLITHTPNPDNVVATAAKLCYSSKNLTELYEKNKDADNEKFLKKLTDLGHESPLEHAVFTFGIEGVSRALLAQFTRHRIASYSVKSQRYVNETTATYVLPTDILATEEARITYFDAIKKTQEAYDQLLKIGIEKEDARMVLPNACTTQMIVTMNARSLLNFFRRRCCNRAQWEIRDVADEMLRQCKAVAPLLFAKAGAPCMHSSCTEGDMCCKKPRKVEEYVIQ